MPHIESFSTDGLDPRYKLAAWNERASQSFSPLVSEPADVRQFRGTIERATTGELSLTEIYSEAQIVRHSRSHVARTKESVFFVPLQLEGECITRQDGREALLQAGDFTLFDSTRRYEMVFNGPNRMLVLSIPSNILRRQLGCPEALVSISMPGGSGASGLLSLLLRQYWREIGNGLDQATVDRVPVAILDLIGASYATVPEALAERSSLCAAHRLRIVNYIETHLSDPELTPTRVAHACKITPRYLHYLFSDRDETAARYILRRRLELCARALRSPALRGRTVTAIAFDHGFNSPTHFGRVFRAYHKMTPREFRHETIPEGR